MQRPHETELPVPTVREYGVRRAMLAMLSTDTALTEHLRLVLANASVVVAPHADIRRFVAEVGNSSCDVVILDDRTCKDSATQVRRLRRAAPLCQLICVNVATDMRVRLLLDLGADDAITEGSSELSCRIHAAVRRAVMCTGTLRQSATSIGLEPRSRLLRCDGHAIALSPRESALLELLLTRQHEAVSIAALHEQVWGGSVGAWGHPRVRVYIGYLRRKLEHRTRLRIRTVRGIGYRLEVEPRA